MIFSLILLCFALPAAAQQVSGRAYTTYAQYGTCCYATNFNIKWCKADANGRPTTACGATVTNQFGDFGYNVGQGTGWYFPYLWRDDIYWGSPDYPANGPAFFQAGSPNFVVGTLESRPRARPPTVVYPAEGQVNVPVAGMVIQWTDGLDPDRRRADWPVTYDIWASGNEFPQLKIFENVPCNNTPGSNVCRLPIPTKLDYTARYEWRVVARMHSGPIVQQAGLDNSYYTSSATFHFSTEWDPLVPIYTIRAQSGNNLKFANAGGGAVDFTGLGSTYETQFQIIDPNGGSLFSGDPIHLRSNRNYYLMADNGGGFGVSSSKWAMGWETWSIVRIAGFGSLSPGDQIALRAPSGHYLSAAGCGGGGANAAATSIGACETFTFQ